MLRRHSPSHVTRPRALTAAFAAVVLLAAAPAVAQKKASKPDTANSLTGKIKSVEKKGRTLVLSIETENGETIEQILTSRIPVIIEGAGDSGFLRPGTVVFTKTAKIKEKLFGKEFKVYLDGSRQRGAKQGKTPEIIEVTGLIVQLDKKQMTLNVGRVGTGIVQLEEGYKVNIVTGNRDLIVAGAKVTMQGNPARGRFRASAVKVTLEKPLDSQKYFASLEKNSKRHRNRSRPSASASKSNKKSKTSDDKSVTNPFAEIEKKKEK